MAKSKKQSSLLTSAFGRGMRVAKWGLGAGTRAAGHVVSNLLSDDLTKSEALNRLIHSQVQSLTRELGQLKGSMMKVGQMLAMAGENVLPPEALELLRTLQSQAPALEWSKVEPVLRADLGSELLSELEIETEALGAASLGQVHRARVIASGQWLALKVQYPGVRGAIDSDLALLRRMLRVVNLLPTGAQYDDVMAEVREMLHREMDYAQEADAIETFGRLLAGDARWTVPQVIRRYTRGRILATEYMEGVALDDPTILALPEEQKRDLATAYAEIFFKEVFEFGKVQTDPHFGNYRVQLNAGGSGKHRLVLLDFGAVRELTPKFVQAYGDIMRASAMGNRAGIVRAGQALEFLRSEDSERAKDFFADLCILIGEPMLAPQPYDWGASDLPIRIKKRSGELALQFKLRPPPRQIVFVDRKLAGVFFVLNRLRVRWDGRALLGRYLNLPLGG